MEQFYRHNNTDGYTDEQLDMFNTVLERELHSIEIGSDLWHETIKRHNDMVNRNDLDIPALNP